MLTAPSRNPRSRTIIDFDKVLLLDKGRLIEYESPAKLLDEPTSRFYALCRATGKKEFAILKKMSKGKSRVTHRPRKVRQPSFPRLSSCCIDSSPCTPRQLVRRGTSKLGPDRDTNAQNGTTAGSK